MVFVDGRIFSKYHCIEFDGAKKRPPTPPGTPGTNDFWDSRGATNANEAKIQHAMFGGKSTKTDETSNQGNTGFPRAIRLNRGERHGARHYLPARPCSRPKGIAQFWGQGLVNIGGLRTFVAKPRADLMVASPADSTDCCESNGANEGRQFHREQFGQTTPGPAVGATNANNIFVAKLRGGF